VSVRKVNIFSVELDEPLDVAGFRHVSTSVRDRLGAYRIGASIYQGYAGQPIWPYGYHHGVEEWLYVISGRPVLREPAGERTLAPGDLVCFPSGHLGAHALAGPGRFVIFSTGDHVEPWLSVYPDSDKVSGPDGILLRSSAVGYWHGEGTGAPVDDPIVLTREPQSAARQPLVNVLSVPVEDRRPDAPEGFRARTARLGSLLQAERLGATVAELDPGVGSAPYHYEYGREEWVLVLTGTPTLRHPGARRCWRPARWSASPRVRPALTACSTTASTSHGSCSSQPWGCRPTSTTPTAASGCSATGRTRSRSFSATGERSALLTGRPDPSSRSSPEEWAARSACASLARKRQLVGLDHPHAAPLVIAAPTAADLSGTGRGAGGRKGSTRVDRRSRDGRRRCQHDDARATAGDVWQASV
jgi:uncharacterized cupin superfamily protein